jgi:protein-S-isoprenylcysteine O-methyltransferase Ste14
VKSANKAATDREQPQMRKEDTFRSIAAALLLAAAAVSGYHRHNAEVATPEKISAVEEEGLPTAVALRLSGLTLVLSVAAYVINPRRMAWSSVRLPVRVRWAGAVLGAATLPISWWVFESLGKNITPTVATRERHELVTAGPFRWVRHPLYATGTAFFGSLSVVAANWFMGLASLCVLVILLVRLPEEEKRLLERFGGEYAEYMKRTGGLLPRLLRAK